MRYRSSSIASLLVSLALVGGATACSTDPSVSAETTAASETTTTSSAASAAAVDALVAQFPATPPKTVVAASVPLAEVLTLLEIPVAGVPSTTTQQLPAALNDVPRIGSTMAPDVEKIIKLSPDLVIAAETSRSTIEASLASTTTPAAFLETDSFGDLKLAVEVLGEAFDKQAEADKILASMAANETALSTAGASTDAPKVLVLIGATDSFMVMNNNSFMGSLIELSGADNIAVSALGVKETYSAVNLENIIAAAPDVVLVLRSGDVAEGQAAFDTEVAKNAAWKSLPAYANDRIHVLDYATFGYTSVGQLDKAVPTLTGLLYP